MMEERIQKEPIEDTCYETEMVLLFIEQVAYRVKCVHILLKNMETNLGLV